MPKTLDDQIELNMSWKRALELSMQRGVELLLEVEQDGPAYVQQFIETVMQDQMHPLHQALPLLKMEAREASAQLAYSLWKDTPLPSHQYLTSVHWPAHEDDCWCGSGKPFVQCCAQMIEDADSEFFNDEYCTEILLKLVSIETLSTIYQHLSSEVLASIAILWLCEDDEALLERAYQMIEPMFIEKNMAKHPPCEFALQALLAIYRKQVKEAERDALLLRMVRHPDKELRTTAMGIQCLILEEKGLYEKAMAQFHVLQKLDPDNVHLPIIELQLLSSQGDDVMLEKRSTFWLQRLQKNNRDGELDDTIMLVQAVARSFMGDTDEDEDDFDFSLYAGSDESPFAGEYDDEEVQALICLVSDWLDKAEQQLPKLMHEYRVRDGFAYIEPKTKQDAQIDRLWDRKTVFFDDDMGECQVILEENPALAGSIFVINELLGLFEELCELNATDDAERPDIFYIRNKLREMALQLLIALIPEKPSHPFCMEQDPPPMILDYLYEQACLHISYGKLAYATSLLECAMLLDVDDQRKNRRSLVEIYVIEHRDQDVIHLCERFPEDLDSRMLYSYPLALLRSGDKSKAMQYMKKAIEQSPKVADALLRNKMKGVSDCDPDEIVVGSDNEAMVYRKMFRPIWLKTHGAIACLKTCKRKG